MPGARELFYIKNSGLTGIGAVESELADTPTLNRPYVVRARMASTHSQLGLLDGTEGFGLPVIHVGRQPPNQILQDGRASSGRNRSAR
jgi:hypothetical protein